MKNYHLLFVLGMMLLSSCSSLKVTTDFDKTADFTKYKTFEYYGWAKDSDKILNDLDKKRIEAAFGNEFKKRNVEFVKSDGDLVVSLYIVVEQKTQKTATTNYNNYGGYGGYYGYGPGWGYGSGYSTTTVNEYDYKVGTLAISIYDKAEKKLIWESIGQGEINEKPEMREKNTPKMAEKMMYKFPIPPVKE